MKPVDVYIMYQFIRRLSKPFTEWQMYKVGLIDEYGNFLVDKDQRTDEQRSSYSYFDMLILNLKKLLAKIPGGSTRIATFAAALYLLREGHTPTSEKRVNQLTEQFAIDIDRYISESRTLIENEGGAAPAGAPTNNIGGGQVSQKDNPMNVGKMLKRKHNLMKGCGCADTK